MLGLVACGSGPTITASSGAPVDASTAFATSSGTPVPDSGAADPAPADEGTPGSSDGSGTTDADDSANVGIDGLVSKTPVTAICRLMLADLPKLRKLSTPDEVRDTLTIDLSVLFDKYNDARGLNGLEIDDKTAQICPKIRGQVLKLRHSDTLGL
jgi:hypothetical protein